MTTHILFIHGGGEDAYATDEKLAIHLQTVLGAAYTVIYPRMPNPGRPDPAAWKRQIAEQRASLSDAVILVGHSLGGSVLLQYLSEEPIDASLAGLFLLAAPYWGTEDWEVDAFTLRDNFAAQLPDTLPIFLYHSRDDGVVPVAHLAMYAAQLPQATVRELASGGHQFNDDLSEVAADITTL